MLTISYTLCGKGTMHHMKGVQCSMSLMTATEVSSHGAGD